MLTAKQFKFVTIGLAAVMTLALCFMNMLEVEVLDDTLSCSIFGNINHETESGAQGGIHQSAKVTLTPLALPEAFKGHDSASSITMILSSYVFGIICGIIMLIFALRGKAKALKVMTGVCLIAPIMFFFGNSGTDFYIVSFPSAPMIIYLICTLAIGFIWFKAIKEAKPE